LPAKIEFIVVLGWSWVKLLEKKQFKFSDPFWGAICPRHPDADPAHIFIFVSYKPISMIIMSFLMVLVMLISFVTLSM